MTESLIMQDEWALDTPYLRRWREQILWRMPLNVCQCKTPCQPWDADKVLIFRNSISIHWQCQAEHVNHALPFSSPFQ